MGITPEDEDKIKRIIRVEVEKLISEMDKELGAAVSEIMENMSGFINKELGKFHMED
tara:strand:+ start:65 stop:235 length:171 start_codon:yes stop_codon:yes gene_type:complete